MPDGTVHSGYTDPTQATARLVIVIQKSGILSNGKGPPSKVVPNIPNISDRTEMFRSI